MTEPQLVSLAPSSQGAGSESRRRHIDGISHQSGMLSHCPPSNREPPGRLIRPSHLFRNSAIALLLGTNLWLTAAFLHPEQASSHSLGYHWHKRTITIDNVAANQAPADDAMAEWSNDTILTVTEVLANEDIYVFDNNDGNVGYCGAWAPRLYSGTNHLRHGRAMYNTYCSGNYYFKRGIFCQEIGHGFGLDHSDHGCMGFNYWWNGVKNTTWYVAQHNIDDIRGIYGGH